MDTDVACFSDIGVRLLCASGRRDCLWPNKAAYEKAMIAQYGSVAKGQKYRAFQSPHQTGLCIDLECGGVEPVSKTIPEQRKTRLYRWLVDNMWRWGFTPYLAEPWHLEMKVDISAFWAGTVHTMPFSFAQATTCSDENDVCEAPHDWVMA
jgi:D-alanyl-D-alanine dipeptidase